MAISFELPNLSYDYNALEPVISAEIMQLHHSKHHQTYVTNLNKALEQYADAENKKELAKMIALEKVIKFNGGGHINHSIFWQNLAPINQASKMDETLEKAISHSFFSKEQFIQKFSQQAISLQGSGWTWLGFNSESKHLEIATCDNQDPLSTKGLIPLLGVDVWEHAYYLQYKNVRADYVKAIWQIINWQDVSDRYQKALKNF